MDSFENPPSNPSELAELKSQCASLRQTLGGLLLLVIVISGTFNIYLWRQFRMTQADLKVRRPQVGQLLTNYQRITVPRFNDFLKKLSEYEKTHPDFTYIMTKYNLKPTGITGAPPASVSPPK